jgi:hypothetical protein
LVGVHHKLVDLIVLCHSIRLFPGHTAQTGDMGGGQEWVDVGNTVIIQDPAQTCAAECGRPFKAGYPSLGSTTNLLTS